MPDKECLNQRFINMEDKLESTKEMLEAHRETLEIHKETLEHHNKRLGEMATSQLENMALTQQIVDNTGEMVRIFKEAKVVFRWGAAAKKFVIWFASVTAALLYFWEYFVEWYKK